MGIETPVATMDASAKSTSSEAVTYKKDIKKRIGGQGEFEMVMNCYIDNILQDLDLTTKFPTALTQNDVSVFMEQQHKAVEIILAENPEHADIRMAIYFQDLQGFRQDDFLRFRDHFLTALRENWKDDENMIQDVTQCFAEYVSVFDRPASPRHPSSSCAETKRKTTTTAASSPDAMMMMMMSPTLQQPKKTATQQTPFGIRALKDKITNKLRSPKSPKNRVVVSDKAQKQPLSDMIAPAEL